MREEYKEPARGQPSCKTANASTSASDLCGIRLSQTVAHGMDCRMHGWIAYLEMRRRPESFPAVREDFHVALAPKDWRINRDWYQKVGSMWAWTDRLIWPETTWHDYVDANHLETWIASFQGEECGYFELTRQDDGVRITLLGLIPQSIGKGLGASLLSKALECAWANETKRVFLDTCSKDHPNALPNYLRHGFQIIRKENL
jgi:GNAT superfamily N-acetyltransferase